MSMPNLKNYRTLLIATGVSILISFVYFLTAARDIVVGDSPELTMAAVTLGVAHPPGYPLFTMLSHLFSFLPVGPVPFRVNLFSVVCNALAVGVVFLTGFQLSRSRLAAAIGAMILAFNPLFWSWSLVAEVFPLNNFLAALLVYLLVIWNNRPQDYGALVGAAFVAGLALTNHQTVVLLGPAVCFLLLRNRAVLLARPRIIGICAGAFLIGLAPYAYLPWAAARHPLYSWGDISSFHDFIAHVTRRGYGSLSLVAQQLRGGSSLLRLLTLFFSFGATMGFFALLGAARSFQKCRWFFWFTLLAFVCAGPVFAIIANFNLTSTPVAVFVLERFFLLSLVIAAPLSALGIAWISEWVVSIAPELPRPLEIIAGALAIVLAVQLGANYRRLDQSRNHIARTFAEDVFGTVDPNAIVLATGDGFAMPLMYLKTIENVRRDVTLIAPPLLPAGWYVRELRRRDPKLNIPFESYDGQQNNLKALVEANPDRPIAVVGRKVDQSLDEAYGTYPLGLFDRVRPKSKRIDLTDLVRDNERIQARLRPPSHAVVNPRSLESEILLDYVQVNWRIGRACQAAGSTSEATKWYERALALDPTSREAREGLARLKNGQKNATERDALNNK
jgi:hypothetical protein